uniref:Mucinlike protein putative n=1 Tax=Albugo laibachii Nc14 TaxID=890382 RepID=F0WNK2_9STRA|nr:mucinlike protein putative [Albugo laibachii Nc14]|eukprot:CCA22893.1 mucinlike protein putative [Albugo laibachii Nc14]
MFALQSVILFLSLYGTWLYAAADTCNVTVSSGDASVGLDIITDENCVSGGLGCVNDNCRFCKVEESPQSHDYDLCPKTRAGSSSSRVEEPSAMECTATVSLDDYNVGIRIIHDTVCEAGGLGCFATVCRYCKILSTPLSEHFGNCTEYRGKYTTSPVPAISDATCASTVSDGDYNVGIQIVTDSSCKDGGLGCFSGACRFCRYKNTTFSAHLGSCDDYGKNYTRPVPFPTTSSASSDVSPVTQSEPCSLTVSPDDANAGIELLTDATCVNGGLGCYSDVCRFCKSRNTPLSQHFVECADFDASSASSDVVVTPSPLAVEQNDTTSGSNATPAVNANCTATISAGDYLAGVQIVTDFSCASGGLGCFTSECRFCQYLRTPLSAHLERCSDWGSQYTSLNDETVAKDAADAEAPVADDKTQSSGKSDVGTETPIKAPVTDDKTQSLQGDNDLASEEPVPSLDNASKCSVTISDGDFNVGIQIVTDPSCVDGGLGCITNACRFCSYKSTPSSQHLEKCDKAGNQFTSLTEQTISETPSVPPTEGSSIDETNPSTDIATEGSAEAPSELEPSRPTPSTGSRSVPPMEGSSYDDTNPSTDVTTEGSAEAPSEVEPSPSTPTTDVTAEGSGEAPTKDVNVEPTHAASTDAEIDSSLSGPPVLAVPPATPKPDDGEKGSQHGIYDEPSPSAPKPSPSPPTTDSDATPSVEPKVESPQTSSSGTEEPAKAVETPVGTSSLSSSSGSANEGHDMIFNPTEVDISEPTTPEPTQAPAFPTTCTKIVSAGDALVGVDITTDASCLDGGAGCIDGICRYCKRFESVQSSSFVPCDTIEEGEGNGISFAPIDSSFIGVPSDSSTYPAPDAIQNCDDIVSYGDRLAGINAVRDESCATGGEGCFTNDCRYCQSTLTELSAQLAPCVSDEQAASSSETPSSTSTEPSSTAANDSNAQSTSDLVALCGDLVAATDLANGVYAMNDSTCASGGIGCFSNDCRYCKTANSPEAHNFVDCYRVTKDGIVGEENTTSTNLPPATPVGITDNDTAAVVGNCEDFVSFGDKFNGINAVYDTSCAPGGLGCFTTTCRFCSSELTPKSEDLLACDNLNATTTSSVISEPEPAPVSNADIISCGSFVSPGDLGVGIYAMNDTSCQAGGLGCFADTCRFCQQSETIQSSSYVPCYLVTPYGVKTTDQEFVSFTGSTSNTSASSMLQDCDAIVTEGDKAVGVQGIDDPNCYFGGLGCFTSNCRFCHTEITNKSAHLFACSDVSQVKSVKVQNHTVNSFSCGDTVASGDLEMGIYAMNDSTCVQGGLGCFSDSCRFCKTSLVTNQSAPFYDCYLITMDGVLQGEDSVRISTSAQAKIEAGKASKYSSMQYAAIAASAVGAVAMLVLVGMLTRNVYRRTKFQRESSDTDQLGGDVVDEAAMDTEEAKVDADVVEAQV